MIISSRAAVCLLRVTLAVFGLNHILHHITINYKIILPENVMEKFDQEGILLHVLQFDQGQKSLSDSYYRNEMKGEKLWLLVH